MSILDFFRRPATKSAPVIRTSKDLFDELGITYLTDAGEAVTAETALRLSAVYSCVRVLSNTIGTLPLRMYERKGDTRKEVTQHSLAKLVTLAPNEFQTPQEFIELIVTHLGLRGAFFAYKVRDGSGGVRELLPWQPGAVTPKLDEQFNLMYEVQYENGLTDVLTQRDVFHVRMHTLDVVNGFTPIWQGRQTIGHGLAMDKHGSKLFANGAQIGGILTTENVFKDQAAIDRLRKSWRDSHQGTDNAHKTAILENGLKYQPMGMTQEDAQFIESKKLNRSEIAGLFGVPPHMIGELDRATFSNIEHQSLEFYRNGVLPYLTRIEQRLRTSLVREDNQSRYFFKFNVNSLLRGDLKTRAEYYTRQIQNGVLSPNEVRAFEDMNPRPDGDVYLTPMNMAIDGKPIESATDTGENSEAEDDANET